MDKIEVDLLKVKEILVRILTHPLNKDGSLIWQMGDLMIDLNGMVEKQKAEPIFLFKTGSESEKWRIEFRESKEGMNELPFMIIQPKEWIKTKKQKTDAA